MFYLVILVRRWQPLMAYLDHLHAMASRSVMGGPNEYDAYGVITEAFIYHKNPYDRFTIFPQLYLRWKPTDPSDRRGSIPNFVLGQYINAWPWVQLQGGAEVKRAMKKMEGLPHADTMALDDELQKILQVTRGQARDQAVSAIKELRMPNRKLKWLLFVGPYFAEVELGPFSDAELQTRKHKPNPSGDVVELIIAKLEKQASPVYLPLYRLGTVEAAMKLED